MVSYISLSLICVGKGLGFVALARLKRGSGSSASVYRRLGSHPKRVSVLRPQLQVCCVSPVQPCSG